MNRQVDARSKLKMMCNDYKMTVREIAKVMGVNFCCVSWWMTGKHEITKQHYSKLCDMSLMLAGKNIKYKGQALDILEDMKYDRL